MSTSRIFNYFQKLDTLLLENDANKHSYFAIFTRRIHDALKPVSVINTSKSKILATCPKVKEALEEIAPLSMNLKACYKNTCLTVLSFAHLCASHNINLSIAHGYYMHKNLDLPLEHAWLCLESDDTTEYIDLTVQFILQQPIDDYEYAQLGTTINYSEVTELLALDDNRCNAWRLHKIEQLAHLEYDKYVFRHY